MAPPEPVETAQEVEAAAAEAAEVAEVAEAAEAQGTPAAVETDLDSLSSEEKLALARKRRMQGNVHFGAEEYSKAAKEYFGASQVLIKLSCDPGLTAEQAAQRNEELVSTNLNAAACKLKLDRPREAIEYATAVLEVNATESKALFRLGQAHAALAEHKEAKEYLVRAEEAAAGDEERVKAIRQERARLAARMEKQKKEQKQIYGKMMNEGKAPPPPPPARVQQWIAFQEMFARVMRHYPMSMRYGVASSLILVSLGVARLITGEITPEVLMITCMPVMMTSNYLFQAYYPLEVRSKVRQEQYYAAKSRKDFMDKRDEYFKAREDPRKALESKKAQ